MHQIQKHGHGSPWKVLALVGTYALIHSALASLPAKRLAQRLAGQRLRNGLYRPFYIAQATVTTALAIRIFVRLPDRELYQARPPWSWMLRLVQAGGLSLLASAVTVVGWRRLTGIESAMALWQGGDPPREPEAQGPPPTEGGEVAARGPFRHIRHIRHPDNLPIILVLWAFPRMTVNRLTLAMASSLYAVLGSWHEDFRLRTAYGKPFEEYSLSVPMLIPKWKPVSIKEPREGAPPISPL